MSEPSGEVNVLAENIPRQKIRFIGTVMIDTLARELPTTRALGGCRSFGLVRGGDALVTPHRPSKADGAERQAGWCAGFRDDYWSFSPRIPTRGNGWSRLV